MRIAVLVSGRGSNLQALIDARESGALEPAELVAVISNRPGVAALDRARAANIAAITVDHKQFDDRGAFERAMLRQLREHAVEAIVLAGFMRVLTDTFLDEFPARIINTHPSLLPAFAGMAAPQQAISHGVKLSGCTVHFVEAGVDTGPIIAQRAVPVLDDDTAESLHSRIQAVEHQMLPAITALLAADQLRVHGRSVRTVD